MPGINGEIKFSMDENTMFALQKFGEKLEHFEYILNKLSDVTEKLTSDLNEELRKFEKTIERLENKPGSPWNKRL